MTATAATPDTLAFIEAIMRNPDDLLAQDVYRDYLKDRGATDLAATRQVNKVCRTARDLAQVAMAEKFIGEENSRARRVRAEAKAYCGCTNRLPAFVIVPGDSAPVRAGEEAYSTFRNGGRCEYPGAAIRAGYKTDYHASTLTVTIGAGWVCARM